MDLDLDRMLAAVEDGQWSVDQLDWSQPFVASPGFGARERREVGLALVFTARLERQAARIFELSSHHVDDPRAQQIFRWFAVDEERHAEAELRLAARHGVGEDDLPRLLKWALGVLEHNFDPSEPAVHELSSASIILFELALDTLLVPSIKELGDDPLQAQVFRRIDLDESRHLAMDYWLLDQKGIQHAGVDARTLLGGDQPRTWRQRLRGRYRLLLTLGAAMAAFGTTTVTMPTLRRAVAKGRMDRYIKRVAAVPKKAPHALDLATYRMSLAGQRRVLDLMARLS